MFLGRGRILSMSFVILNTEREAGGVITLLRKNCMICGKASYSSSERGSWICPFCNTDLAKERIMDASVSEPAQARDQSMSKLWLQDESLPGKF